MKKQETNECKRCGKCCITVAIPIEFEYVADPRTVDNIKWMLSHPNISLARDNHGKWAVIVHDKCIHYNHVFAECAIYEDRFQICMEHDPNRCLSSGKATDGVVFDTPDEFLNWLDNPWRKDESEGNEE